MGSDRRTSNNTGTEVSPDIIKKIIQGSDIKLLVGQAEKLGRELANEGLTTSQIRVFFSQVKQIDITANKDELEEKDQRKLILLKPKLAYQAKRHGRGVAKLEKILSQAIDLIGNNKGYFRNFVDFFEAILAYHKAQGGRD